MKMMLIASSELKKFTHTRLAEVKKPLLFAFSAFMVIGLVWWQLSLVFEKSLIEQKRAVLKSQTEEIGALLTSQVNYRQAQLTGLSASVMTHSVEELRNLHFNRFAAGLRSDDPVIRVIQFFPPYGACMVYPVEGNEAVLGTTLEDLRTTNRTNVRLDVQRAIDTREITLSDPYELRQGGQGVVARRAVYDGDEFRGIVVIVLNLDPLLELEGFAAAAEDVHYALLNNQDQVFYGSEQTLAADPVLVPVLLPEGRWILAASPAAGWQAGLLPQLAFFWLTGALLAALSGAIVYLIFSRQAVLVRMVQERTAALQKSEERYAMTLQVVNEGIWDLNLQTGESFASPNCSMLLGYSENILYSLQDWLACIHPDEVAQAEKALRQGSLPGNGFDVEMRLRRKDGGWALVLVRGRVVGKNSAGENTRMVGTLTDISQQKLAEGQLRESESRFRALYNNNHAAMMLVAPESGAIIDVNPAACAYYGWSKAEMTAMNISEINLLDQAEVEAEMQRALAEQRSYFQFRHRLASGEVRDVEVFSGPIDQNGRTLLYSIIHDATARKQAEAALLESENRLRFALEGANDGLWDVQMKTDAVYISPRGCEILGYAPHELEEVVQVWQQLVHPEDMPESSRRLNEHLAGRTPVFEVEQRLRTKSGGWKWVLTRGKLVERNADGQPLRMTGIHTDITSRKQAEEKALAVQAELQRLLAEADGSRKVLLSVIEDQHFAEEKLSQLNAELELRVQNRTAQLEAANKELEAFSYSVSHDLRSPLRGIDGWSLALQEDYASQLDEKANQYLERVRSETRRMAGLIDDLLRLSRVTRAEMNPAATDLSGLVKGIAHRLQEENPERQVEFRIQPEVSAMGDAHLLEIVLTNLLSNAYKFTGKKSPGLIEFGKDWIDGLPVYYVRDNGAGFDMAYAGNLFGAFQRMHKQSEFPGTGVGLATVQRIIARHGGKVWSTATKNEGATFFFTLKDEGIA